MRVMDTHSAENCESFDEILVVLGKRKIVEFINQLYDADNLPRRILYGHAEDVLVLEIGAIVYVRVKSWIIISVEYINSLLLKKNN